MPDEWIEVTVAVQQLMALIYAEGRDEYVSRAPGCNTETS